ncbi:MAG: sugar transferase [Bacteroidaceae bacterium]|nr:sugar transferase [Bacteroidaceae bacterium]
MSKGISKISTQQSKRHWFRDGLTLLAEAFLWAACFYVISLLQGTKTGDAPLHVWLLLWGWGFAFLLVASYFIPNNAFSQTARRDEVAAQAIKTALVVSILAFAVFTERNSLQIFSCLLFFVLLTAERLILNSWFIHYSIHHSEHGVLICNEDTVWQQQALQQNTYGLKLTRLTEQTAQQLEEYLTAHPETESIYCTPSAMKAAELEAIAHICQEQGLMLHLLPQPVFTLNKEMQSECRGVVNVLSPAKLPLQNLFNRIVKRLTDIVLSLLILLTIFPIFAAIAYVCIKRQSRGPVFTIRHACGMNGKTFDCLTFRTRHYEAAPSFLDGINDPGYFPFGKFLVHSRMELLPQFLCVLWGNMTIVGSQMIRPEHYSEYRQTLKRLFALGYHLKAGITNYHFPSQAKSSTSADVWYYRNWSFWLDIRIMFQRLGTLLNNSKAKSINYI